MYDAEYGTDWDGIGTEEAIERAYALGVAESLGEAHTGELERLIEAADTAHDRALVQLAYDKGRNRGREAADEPSGAETVWSELVNDVEREPVTVDREADLPRALRGLPMLDPPGDGLDRIRLPRFLLRR